MKRVEFKFDERSLSDLETEVRRGTIPRKVADVCRKLSKIVQADSARASRFPVTTRAEPPKS